MKIIQRLSQFISKILFTCMIVELYVIPQLNGQDLISLGDLGGGFSIGCALNDADQVVGWSKISSTGTYASFVYSYDTKVMTRIGSTTGYGRAMGINSKGIVTGQTSDADGNNYVYSYSTATGVINFGNFGGRSSARSTGRGINDSGVIIGYSPNSSDYMQAVVYNDGNISALGTLGGAEAYGVAINNKGSIAGYAQNIDNEMQAYIYSNGIMKGISVTGSAPSGILNSKAYAINESDAVAGYAVMASGRNNAFLYTSEGTVINLGTNGGTDSIANGINNDETVVGTITTLNGTYGFLYADGTMKDLNDLYASFLVDADGDLSGFLSFDTASDINNKGHITGQGTYYDAPTKSKSSIAYLLTVPEPSIWEMFAVGVSVLFIAQFRRNRV